MFEKSKVFIKKVSTKKNYYTYNTKQQNHKDKIGIKNNKKILL